MADQELPGQLVRLPGCVTPALLRDAVAGNRSWRGVLRHFGMNSPRYGRQMQQACDLLGISYEHFSGTRWEKITDQAVATAIAEAASWGDVMLRLGYAYDSGSARATLRKRALGLGIDISHLSPVKGDVDNGPFAGAGSDCNIRKAAAFLVAAKCALLGHGVSWPLEPQSYDLLIETATHGILRVQVKSGTHFVDGTWRVAITRGQGHQGNRGERRAYTAEEIDYFAVVDGEQQVYMIPIEDIEGQKTLSLRKFEGYRIAC